MFTFTTGSSRGLTMVGPEENCQIQCPTFWDHLENAVLGSFVAR